MNLQKKVFASQIRLFQTSVVKLAVFLKDRVPRIPAGALSSRARYTIAGLLIDRYAVFENHLTAQIA
jgi:hypothetical protein